MKIVVSGSREGFSYEQIWNTLDEFRHVRRLQLVLGGASGVDTFAQEWAESNSVPHEVIYAKWETHGKRAGYLRNVEMFDRKPDLHISFWNGESKGTKHSIDLSLDRKIDTYVYSPWEEQEPQ